MKDLHYRIVYPFRFDFSDYYWNKFAEDSDEEPVLRLSCEKKATDAYDVQILPVYKDGKVFGVSDSILCVNGDFSEGKICVNGNDRLGIHGCAMIALYGNLIRRSTLVMHSSLIDCNGNGILFTGPSGIGKTTQAELWQRFRNAEIINGDMTFVHREGNGEFYAYGSPWHGSSEYCVNKRLPIKAIIVLGQSRECTIKELNGREMLTQVFPEVMLPDWFEGCKELGLGTLDGLLKHIPVYKLECTKDAQAVEIVEKKLGKLV